MPSFLDKVYASSPTWVQNIGVTAYGVMWRQRRYGGSFRHYVSEFSSRERLTREQWRRYQSVRLAQLLEYAAENVPAYRETLRLPPYFSGNSTWCAIEQLHTIPILEKGGIREDPLRFVSERVAKHQIHTHYSSGTTGTPLAIKLTSDVQRRWAAAYETRVRNWAGVTYRMGRAMIGGRIIVPSADSGPPFWRYNPIEKQLYMSAFHISPRNVKHYVSALSRYRPEYLVGYASSHYFLARMIIEQGLDVWSPKAVLTSSEKLTSEMRATISGAYQCQVYDAYSGVEACCLASECEHHRLHVSPDVGIIELLDENGTPVKVGEQGEIVATGLLNHVQPLIRYRTGDLAVWDDEPCPCGRQMPVLKELVGRLEDTVIGRDGRETVRFHGIFVGLPNVVEGQVIQEEVSQFRLRLVSRSDFGESEEQIIRNRFEERLGPVEVTIEHVESIPRTERGKFRAVVSHVNRSPHQRANG